MITSKSAPKSGEGSGLWLLKIVSGLLVIVILAVHFTVNHMLGSMAGLMTYEEVVLYYANNLIVPIMEILFVTFVVSHALLGLRGIILDMHPTRKTLRVINWVFVIVGVGSIAYGIGLVIVIVQRGLSI
jgi:succinate dehydrogenase / fumarate reductase membrane anchor subunit